jgi:hypothetical protein
LVLDDFELDDLELDESPLSCVVAEPPESV